MTNKTCYICGGRDFHKRQGTVRGNDSLEVLECDNCGLVFLSDFTHISDDHYEKSGMHDYRPPDINEWLKITGPDDQRRFEFIADLIAEKAIVDFGCGNAGFLDRAKKIAGKVAGIELEAALTGSFEKRKLTVYNNLNACSASGQEWDVVTAFHVIEHLPDPRRVLKGLVDLLKAGGELIIEVPNGNDALLTLYQNRAFQDFTYWDQHLFLFTQATLSTLVEQAGLDLNWIKHVQRYSLNNHLHWLAIGEADGHYTWSQLDDKMLAAAYEAVLASNGLTDTIIASIKAKAQG